MALKSMIPAVSVPTEGEFNKHPVLTLPNPDNVAEPGIQMGVKKLRAVLHNVAACQAFVTKHYKPKTPAADPAAVKVAEDKVAKLTKLLRAQGMSEEDIKNTLAA